ncbi:Zinc finger PHD-finger [Penicillium canariense]|uniref:Chromatin modification-related protein n=1 Tax=Penicillium canariense TaxID=189055 RepID=A0A9W9I5G4_9EURO|nr:Zinc finger PHD-finger [Penicillium canariense]KAJ5168225.1 Zinc finger PHD-finger [Penicillium canariense]
MSAVSSSAINPQGQGLRQSARQTRTNPSRTSKTIGRSSFGFGRGLIAETPATTPVPHGFYPALTHFTDAITALPREFRRHNSLLKEVDAKAWALEENLLQLLQISSQSQPVPHPSHPAPIVGGLVREDYLPKELSQSPESPESKNRRLLFDRVRQSLGDLMMTADEKNHVISNANEELDRQIVRLDTVFPYIAGEISDEARLGSLTHWAYSNKSVAKAATNERPRREAVGQRQDLTHVLHEAEAASRSEARREAVRARARRPNADADYEEARAPRKTNAGKSRGDNATGDNAAPKRRKVERPAAMDVGAPMERSASGAGGQRAANKDGAEKKRSRAPNPNAVAARKKTNAASNAGSPILAPSPLIGTFNNTPRGAASPGPNTSRPQSSRAQQNAGQTSISRQRPSSSASNRIGQPNSSKPADPRATPREPVKHEIVNAEAREFDGESGSRPSAPTGAKREDLDRPADATEPEPTSKGRSSKTSTPLLSTLAEPTQSRSRPTRSNDSAPKRTTKKTPAQRTLPSDEESIHEGDDEDEDHEPRYCYCNEVSFGEMVACDNDACPREWFHLSCVGMTKPPGKNVKWYCNECKENMRRSRNGR